MKKEKRVEITLTTERTISIRSNRAIVALCSRCEKHVRWAAPDLAAFLSGLSAREVYRRVESHSAHFAETGEGMLLVCLNSLREESQVSLTDENEIEES